jgi:hypothetical protein
MGLLRQVLQWVTTLEAKEGKVMASHPQLHTRICIRITVTVQILTLAASLQGMLHQDQRVLSHPTTGIRITIRTLRSWILDTSRSNNMPVVSGENLSTDRGRMFKDFYSRIFEFPVFTYLSLRI